MTRLLHNMMTGVLKRAQLISLGWPLWQRGNDNRELNAKWWNIIFLPTFDLAIYQSCSPPKKNKQTCQHSWKIPYSTLQNLLEKFLRMKPFFDWPSRWCCTSLQYMAPDGNKHQLQWWSFNGGDVCFGTRTKQKKMPGTWNISGYQWLSLYFWT